MWFSTGIHVETFENDHLHTEPCNALNFFLLSSSAKLARRSLSVSPWFTHKSTPFWGYEALYVSKTTFVSVFTYARSCHRSTSRHRRPQSPASFWRLPLLVSRKVLCNCPEVQGAMQLGKLPGRTLAVTGVAGPLLSRLFFVSDPNTHTFSRWHRIWSECHPSIAHRSSTLTSQTHPHGSERYSHLYVQKALTHPQPWTQAIASMDFHRRWCTATHPWCWLWTVSRHAATPADWHSHSPAQSVYSLNQPFS